MTLMEISQVFKIPIRDLQEMHKDGFIGELIEEDQIAWFALLRHVYGNAKYLRRQLLSIKRDRRFKLLEEQPMGRQDSYIYQRYMNLQPGATLTVGQVAIELQQHFSVPVSERLLARIRKIRQKAKNNRQYRYRRKSTESPN
jgi:hypothetical protein